jgi:hypothetical protein
LKAIVAKVEIGVEVSADPCSPSLRKPKAEACLGPLCANTNDERKGFLDLDEGLRVKNPIKGSGLEGKVVGKICQQAKW